MLEVKLLLQPQTQLAIFLQERRIYFFSFYHNKRNKLQGREIVLKQDKRQKRRKYRIQATFTIKKFCLCLLPSSHLYRMNCKGKEKKHCIKIFTLCIKIFHLLMRSSFELFSYYEFRRFPWMLKLNQNQKPNHNLHLLQSGNKNKLNHIYLTAQREASGSGVCKRKRWIEEKDQSIERAKDLVGCRFCSY